MSGNSHTKPHDIYSEPQTVPDSFSPGWRPADQHVDGNLLFLAPWAHPCHQHVNKAWVTFLASAPGQMPFADGLHCAE